MPVRTIRQFLKLESSSGILLMIAAVVAMFIANSPLAGFYDFLLQTTAQFSVGDFGISKPILLWINDGLMAIFFLLVGLEVKREILEGELSSLSQVVLPGLAAVGGMLIPALIYVGFNRGDPIAISGWAIPVATDIAFALGVLLLIGKGVPTALKVLLLTIAIFDDLGAITIIAIFYSGDLSTTLLIAAAVITLVLFLMNRFGVHQIAPFMMVGIVLWVVVLKSGVHATLAGVILAFSIPMRSSADPEHSPLRELEHDLHAMVAYGILPIFAFANAGVSLKGFSFSSLLNPVPLGIALGLIAGKQIGVFGFSWLGIRLGIAKMPENIRWSHLYGVAILCGVGFTMSLFIASLAFQLGGPEYSRLIRLGILAATLISGLWGYLVLKGTTSEQPQESPQRQVPAD